MSNWRYVQFTNINTKKEIGGLPNMVNGITLAVGSSKNFTDLEIFFVIFTHGCKRQIGGIDS